MGDPRRVSSLTPLQAWRIIVGPALKPLRDVGGVAGIVLSGLFLLLFALGDGPTDPQRVRVYAARHQLRSILTALRAYRADCGGFPSVRQGLPVLVSAPGLACWHGPYLQVLPADPWGRPYHYDLHGALLEVFSFGADGKPGGESFDADISTNSLDQPMPEQLPSERRLVILRWMYICSAIIVFVGSLLELTLARRRRGSIINSRWN